MKLSKKVFVAASIMIASGFAFAQTSKVQNANNSEEEETSVESEYLNDANGDIILTLAESDEYDNKLVALQFLQEALESGNTSDAVIQALDRLAGEGLTSQSRTNGRLSNNFPDIRREACKLLAKIPSEHSKNTLVSIAIADNEPMVVAAACKSLGEIGINENGEVVAAIAFANKRNRVLNPTSSLALEVLTAFETLSDSTENKTDMITEITRIASDYHYVTPVRQKALTLLKEFSNSASDKNKKSDSSSKEVDGN